MYQNLFMDSQKALTVLEEVEYVVIIFSTTAFSVKFLHIKGSWAQMTRIANPGPAIEKKKLF